MSEYDLTKNGMILSLEPVIVQMSDYADFSTFYTGAVVHIDHSKPHPFMADTRKVFQYARHISTKTTRPMTSGEALWILTTPRCVIRHIDRADWEVPTIHAEYVQNYVYGFVNEDGSITEIGKFEKEV